MSGVIVGDGMSDAMARRLVELRKRRGWTQEALAEAAGLSIGVVKKIEAGGSAKIESYLAIAQALGVTLQFASHDLEALADMVFAADEGGDPERMSYVVRHPRRLDRATVQSLASILASQRRIEDQRGSAAVLGPVTAQAGVVNHLVRESADNEVRRALMDVGSQWAQFAGWITETTAHYPDSLRWYTQAMEWAGEADNPDLFATAISMRGHLAWVQDKFQTMVRLSRAATWQPTCLSVKAMAMQQEARGLALLGDATAADERLDRAEELAATAAHHPQGEQDWMYFYDQDYFAMQRGLADLYLGRYERAIERLTGGLDRIPAEIRGSDWVAWYVLRLGEAYVRLGESSVGAAHIAEAESVAVATGAERLCNEIRGLVDQLRLGHAT